MKSLTKDTFNFSEKSEKEITILELQFIFSQAEKLLIESIGSGESVLTRTTILISIVIALISSGLGLMISSLNDLLNSANLIASVAIVLVYLGFALQKLYLNFIGKDYKVVGSQPKDLLHNWYFDNYKEEQTRSKAILISEIKEYQERISENNIINRRRWHLFHCSLLITASSPVIFLFCYLLFSIFLPPL